MALPTRAFHHSDGMSREQCIPTFWYPLISVSCVAIRVETGLSPLNPVVSAMCLILDTGRVLLLPCRMPVYPNNMSHQGQPCLISDL